MQGRFKRDGAGRPQARQGQGEAAAEQEPLGGTDRSAAQHAQGSGQQAASDADRAARGSGAAPATPEQPAAPKPAGPSSYGSRIAMRNWRISTRLVSLLALPVAAATVLGGLRIQQSLDDMAQLDHIQLLTNLTKEATDLAQALQEERDLTAGPLANGAPDSDYKVVEPRKATDRAQEAFLKATDAIGDTEGDDTLSSIRTNVNQIATDVNQIRAIRQQAYDREQDGTKLSNSVTVEGYSRIIEGLLSLSQDMAQATSNPEMIKRTRALAAFSAAKEYASIQRAIIAAALPPTDSRQGHLAPEDQLYGNSARLNEGAKMTAFRAIYESSGGNAEELTAALDGGGNPSIDAANSYAARVLGGPYGLDSSSTRRGYLDWTDEDDTKIQAMKTIELALLGEMESKARELRSDSQRDALLNGALVLIVLGVSLVGAFVMARSMIRSLRRLQDTATKVAQDRLPELVKQLSESDPQDVDTSVESVGVHSRDEIGQVASAFDDVHREAVRLAAEQALLRGNVNAMFTNLSRRSQGLIQRQLSLISELESREADPDQLASLFKLDHLATRMRRNGENLLVLAGEEPGRRWTRPVPLVDVLRAAASEVEQYERIELAQVPATEVAGRVVNDLVHLLAELLENATSFSSPQTKVRVTGHALPDGRVLVEIHDTGIGLSPEDLAAINERLASPPTVDVSVSRRMGLFVVGRLSLRHGIRIQLRPSDSGGTTALVMLPVDVAQGGRKPAPPVPGAGAGQNAVPGGQPNQGNRLPGGPGGAPRPQSPGQQPHQGGGPQGGRPVGPAPQRGQVGAGQAPRAALPARDGGPQAGPGPQGSPGAPQRPQGAGGLAGAFSGAAAGRGPLGNSAIPSRTDVWQNGAQASEQSGQVPGREPQRPAGPDARRLPPGGGPRAELPGGTPQPQHPQQPHPQQPQPPQGPSWGAEAPRGHEEPESTGQFARMRDERPGAGDTAQFARPDYDAPRPDARPYGQDPASTGQFARPGFGAPQPQAPQPGPAPRRREQQPQDFGAPRPQVGSLPAQPQPEALPPAQDPGDGRTPLYDTLETNWFRTEQQGGPQQPAPQQRPDQTQPVPVVPQQPAGERPAPAAPQHQAGQGPNWRPSPNDDLGRQAERVRKPAAGGVTTSGLPRRVPRANLVAGTAQEQQHQAGPQVSRAPDDVRGRLTNLRRGIQQGRQAGGNTGSFNLGPTHQQER
ncbi:nitrate- and nitrite sensing domain-containing protein [Streptomyces sp. NPDC001941]|uniref:sensor histidine kinase n=1 Tax=Streptomyces sp. NPDC001941 TaxID=3154659 RepID=UPI003325A871